MQGSKIYVIEESPADNTLTPSLWIVAVCSEAIAVILQSDHTQKPEKAKSCHPLK